jgi:predicted aspartyl protease
MLRLSAATVLAIVCVSGILWTLPARADADVAPDSQRIYHLDLSDGSPVVTDYMVDGLALRPCIDTGCTSLIAVPTAVYDKLKAGDPSSLPLMALDGNTSDQGVSLVQLPLLGSERKRWFFALAYDPEEGDSTSSIFSLDTIDADFVIFLISRKELLLADIAPSAVSIAGDSPLKSIPYFDCSTGIFVAIAYQGVHYAAQIDTGAGGTTYFQNFVTQHPELFAATGDSDEIEGVNVTMDAPAYDLHSGVVICGVTPEDDIPLSGEISAFPAFDSDGNPTVPTEPGDPSSLPYTRADAPGIAPVGSIGMDVLGAYDFIIDRRDKMIYYWPPSETPKLFPESAAAGK